MQNHSIRRLYQNLAAGLLSILLMLPTIAKFAHDYLEHHSHELCADELKGEVHYHRMETECHFQPVYISPYTVSNIAQPTDLQNEDPAYTEVLTQVVYADKPFVVSLRGPPSRPYFPFG